MEFFRHSIYLPVSVTGWAWVVMGGRTPDKEGTAALDLAKTLSTLLSLLDFKRKSVPSFISGLPATAVLNSNLRSLQNKVCGK